MTPLEAYKTIVDQLVTETRISGSAFQIKQHGVFSNAADHAEYNEFICSVSDNQRELLSRMLSVERDGTIHDVLAMLTWWILTKGVGLTFHGASMPVELSGMGLHGDYIGRRDGWDWPT